jgi:hypothetical protein
VTRAIHCHVWEGYHAGNNVYESREVRKWVRELVGTIELARFRDLESLRDELLCLLFQAIVGTSRLPLTSVEAPLPGFSLGQVAYFHRPTTVAEQTEASPVHSREDFIARSLHTGLNRLEQVKHLEFLLRSTPMDDLPAAADNYVHRLCRLGHQPAQLLILLRAVFDEAALSPYTDFVTRTLRFVDLLVEKSHCSALDQVEFLSYLLRHLARHLTAYDLVTFHHRGANYPDALFLDAALKRYLELAEQYPALFFPAAGDTEEQRRQKRIRRRGLRQGWLLRCFHEGLAVPDAPTSPGENARVLPPRHERVPEEQIFAPAKRSRKLFADDPLPRYLCEHTRRLLRLSLQELSHPQEMRELGMALFLDRPLSPGKAPGEPDQTLLLSYEASSRSIARRRLELLEPLTEGVVEPLDWSACRHTFEALPIEGIGLGSPGNATRPGAVSVEDARKVAEDMRFLRTTRRSVADFLAQFDFASLGYLLPVDYLVSERPVLILREGGEGLLAIYDALWRKRLELRVDARGGYERRAGTEYPCAGLQVLRFWEPVEDSEQLRARDLEGEGIIVPPCA